MTTSALVIFEVISNCLQIVASTMSESPRWVQLVKTALRKNSSPTNKYIQVATVRRDGRPACRTVVYRGFRDEQSMVPKLTFTTDSRSEKVGQVQHQSWAEICWYFAVCFDRFLRLVHKWGSRLIEGLSNEFSMMFLLFHNCRIQENNFDCLARCK